MKQYKAIIFDLGNVIFKCSFDNALHYWADRYTSDYNNLKDKFKLDHYYELFEINAINPDDYKLHVADLLNINFKNNDFEIGWNSIYEEIIPGTTELLNNLNANYRLVALTNTNVIHYPIWINKYKSELDIFENIFSSHLIKTRKPDYKSYEMVLEYLNLLPSQVIFLDDNNDNVAAAIKYGINSIQVSSFDKMVNDLISQNVIIN
jgi:glucose-1-phosphatase